MFFLSFPIRVVRYCLFMSCSKRMQYRRCRVLVFLLIALSGVILFSKFSRRVPPIINRPERFSSICTNCTNEELKYFPNGTVDFRGFDNVRGFKSGCCVVPDIVHLIKFNQEDFEFIEFICIASILKNHKPGVLMIHTNVFQFQGHYWKAIQRLPEFHRIRVVNLPQLKSIFGRSLKNKNANYHSSDIARLQLMQKYGGIYMDGDQYVVQSLNHYRRFEFVVEWNDGMALGNQMFVAHKDARILTPWLETYREYDGSQWYYNAGDLPTDIILKKNPHLFTRVKDDFGTDTDMLVDNLYKTQSPNIHFYWRDYSAIHLFIRWQPYTFNETSTLLYKKSPIRQMILDVMPDYMNPNHEHVKVRSTFE